MRFYGRLKFSLGEKYKGLASFHYFFTASNMTIREAAQPTSPKVSMPTSRIERTRKRSDTHTLSLSE